MTDVSTMPFHEKVATQIIEQLKNGTAPWIKPWRPGEFVMPYNPISNVRYKGINAMWLAGLATVQGYDDPRWMTYKQTASVDAQVQKGEKGTVIQYWKFHEEQTVLNEKNQPVLDEHNKPIKRMVALERPRVFSAVVFNADQITGLPPREIIVPDPALNWERHEKCEQLLKNSGAQIIHSNSDRAFYSITKDSINLPEKTQFESADLYYATALHELGHWSGHSTRLNRPFGLFKTPEYAKEELRAEIASLILGEQLGIGHNPEHHLSYINSWIKIIEDDKNEIFKACRDAEKIMDYLFSLELEKNRQLQAEQPTPEVFTQPSNITSEKTYLSVPYQEKDAAKKMGARWDKNAKSWYVPEGADLVPLEKWLSNTTNQPKNNVTIDSPVEQFKTALESAGLVIDGDPIMDGQRHRAAVEGDKANEKSGSYVGYLDEYPAGSIQNWKAGIKEKWRATANALNLLSPEEKKILEEHKKEKQHARDLEYEKAYLQKAKKCEERWNILPKANQEHPYLIKKDVFGHGLKGNEQGDLVIPLKDVHGKLWSLQRIDESGNKFFETGAKKSGCFHVIGHLKSSDDVMIAEGYATAATLYAITQIPIAVAFDSGNLKTVAIELKQAYPEKQFFIMGDDDRQAPSLVQKKVNVGREKALEAAEAIGAKAIFPRFLATEQGSDFSDFNDLARSHGVAMVKGQVERSLRKTPEPSLRQSVSLSP